MPRFVNMAKSGRMAAHRRPGPKRPVAAFVRDAMAEQRQGRPPRRKRPRRRGRG